MRGSSARSAIRAEATISSSGGLAPVDAGGRRPVVERIVRTGSAHELVVRDVLFADVGRPSVEVGILVQRGAPAGRDADGRDAVVPRIGRRVAVGLAARSGDGVQVANV